MKINPESFYTVKGYQMNSQSKISTACEDYLEMIYRQSLKNGYVRINSLASSLNVNPSSASKMVHQLKEHGLVNFEKYGIVTLTKSGRELGEYLLYRHNVIHKFLCIINSSTNELKQTELIEHYINEKTIKNIETLISKLSNYNET
ncbi:MAG TPA: iron dependent repressor, metal binding and dimerization domain protein [Clostridia bacterium]|nr:iron dependent repressor, metal binding and dimerization domain protein [Clostridia bacterium]